MLQDERGSFLVFARTKHGADRLAKKLARSGSKTAAIHGDRTQSQRNMALRGFQEGSYRVLVATDVAARGVHVEGIAHVVNYDLPQVPEDFIHRVGRTGRAGLTRYGVHIQHAERARRDPQDRAAAAAPIDAPPGAFGTGTGSAERGPRNSPSSFGIASRGLTPFAASPPGRSSLAESAAEWIIRWDNKVWTT